MALRPPRHQLPMWLRWLLIVALTLVGLAGAFGGYRYAYRPVTLTIAASGEGEALPVLNALAARISDSKKLRLKVVQTKSPSEAADLFAAKKVDLAVLRADLPGQGDGRTVVVIAQAVVLVFVPPGSAVDDMDALKGKTIGVVELSVNGRIVDVIAESYGFDRSKFRDVPREGARQALHARQVQALIVVSPLGEQRLAAMRSNLGLKPKQRPGLLAIDQASAIAETARYLESHELPKGTLLGSPPLPDEDLTTLRLPINIVAQRSLDDDTVASLTRIIIDAKGELSIKFPVLAQVKAPDTAKDAYIPVHPGAAAYYDGDEKGFFDRYGDALFYGPMFFGAFASLMAGIWKFLGLGAPAGDADPVFVLATMFQRIREAPDLASLEAIEDEIDQVVESELSARTALGESVNHGDLTFAVSRLERALARRRGALAPNLGERTSPMALARVGSSDDSAAP